MEIYTLTNFRANIYALADEVLRTGEPLLLERGGEKLELRPVKPAKRARKKKINDLSKIVPIPDLLTEDPEWYRHIEWNDIWKPNI